MVLEVDSCYSLGQKVCMEVEVGTTFEQNSAKVSGASVGSWSLLIVVSEAKLGSHVSGARFETGV